MVTVIDEVGIAEDSLLNVCGIYKLTNPRNSVVYIGQSVNVGKRCKTHRRQLELQNHPNARMQADFNKFRETFSVELLIRCEQHDLDRYESLYCYKYDVWDKSKGYNKSKMLDYRKLPKEEAVGIKNRFINGFFSNNYNILNERGRVVIPFQWVSEQLKIEYNKVLIAMREITQEDLDRFDCGFNVQTTAYNEYELTIYTRDYDRERFVGIKLFSD